MTETFIFEETPNSLSIKEQISLLFLRWEGYYVHIVEQTFWKCDKLTNAARIKIKIERH